MVGIWVWIAVAAAVAVAALSFTPLPGRYNVQVTVSTEEISLLVTTYFQINSAGARVTGSSTVLDWGAWFGGFTSPTLSATFSETVTLGGVSSTKSVTQFLPTLPTNTNLGATDTFSLAYVPQGQQSGTVTLTENGSPVATDTFSLCVGC